MKRRSESAIYFLLVALAFVCGFFLLFHAVKIESLVGSAFYFKEDGSVGVTTPGEELPVEISGINMVWWGGILVVVLACIFTMNFYDYKERHGTKRKRHFFFLNR